MTQEVHFRDFTKKRVPIRFKIDDDIFECVPTLVIDDIQQISTLLKNRVSGDESTDVDIDETLAQMRTIYKLFLLAESYEIFHTRLSDRRNPIDTQQLLEIVMWIVELYTKRPTVPSSDSPNGSPTDDGGTDSTAGAPPAELTLSS